MGCKPQNLFSSEQKPIHNTRFQKHPILIPVFGVSMGWLAAPGPSWPQIWGLGGQPEDVFEDILKDVLERRAATQMPEDAPTGNLHFGFGRTPILLFGWGLGAEAYVPLL